MKFLHLGDLHLGKSLYEFELKEDQKYLIDQIIDICVEKKIDAILMAGDIYDKSIPPESAVENFDYFIREIVAHNLKVFAISGNHDSDERLNFGSSLFESQGVYIYSKYDGELKCITVQDEYGPLHIHLLPFVKQSQVRHFYPDAKIEGYDDAVRVAIDSANVDTSERNIILSHQFVIGSGSKTLEDGTDITPELGGSESGSVQFVGTIEKVSYQVYDVFDYVALGHIHSSQRVGRDEVRYAGSLMKYSLKEADGVKRMPVIELKEKGEVVIELVDLKPMREMRHLKGELRKLLAKENIEDTEDFIYVTLTDEDTVEDAIGIFRTHYPNTIHLDYDNAHTRSQTEEMLEDFVENQTFEELITDFYASMYGTELNEDELEIVLSAAKKVGILDETD